MSEGRDEIAFLAEAGRVLAAPLELEEMFARAARHFTRRLGDLCIIDLMTGTPRRVAASRDPALQPLADELRGYRPQAGHPVHEAARRGELLLVPEVTKELRRQIAPEERQRELIEQLGFDSALFAPLVARGRTLGVISLSRKAPLRHTSRDVQLAAHVAERAAAAVDNVVLHEAEHAARRQAEAEAARTQRLQAVTAALASALAPPQVANVILSEGLLAIGASGGAVVLASPDKQWLEVIGFVGYDPEMVRAGMIRLPVGSDAPVARAYLTRQPIFLGSRAEWKAHFRIPPLEKSGHDSWAALPLAFGGETAGALAVSYQGEREFPETERGFLRGLAGLCGQALHRAQLFAAERTARAAAERALRARDEFLSIASHELRTPLTPLLLQLGMLRADLASSPYASRVDSALRQSERLARLTANLLDVARIGAGSFAIDPAEMDLGETVQAAVEQFQEQADRAGVVLTVAAEPLQGRWDPLRVEQVVTNLISNALKYGSTKPIHVAARHDADRAVVEVEDHGIGISAADLGKLFQRYSRAVTPRQFGGLGLGLYISRQIAEAHGGTLEARSVVGSGSVFTFTLPLGGR